MKLMSGSIRKRARMFKRILKDGIGRGGIVRSRICTNRPSHTRTEEVKWIRNWA